MPIANNADPNQRALSGALWSWSILFALPGLTKDVLNSINPIMNEKNQENTKILFNFMLILLSILFSYLRSKLHLN